MDKRATAVNSRLPDNFDCSTPLPRCQAENHGTRRFPPWGNGKGVFFFRLSVCCPLHGYAVAFFSRSALPQTLLCGKAERNPCAAAHGIPRYCPNAITSAFAGKASFCPQRCVLFAESQTLQKRYAQDCGQYCGNDTKSVFCSRKVHLCACDK